MIKNLLLALLTQRGKVSWKREKRREGERGGKKRRGRRGGRRREGEKTGEEKTTNKPRPPHICPSVCPGICRGSVVPYISLRMPFFIKQNQVLSLLESC